MTETKESKKPGYFSCPKHGLRSDKDGKCANCDPSKPFPYCDMRGHEPKEK